MLLSLLKCADYMKNVNYLPFCYISLTIMVPTIAHTFLVNCCLCIIFKLFISKSASDKNLYMYIMCVCMYTHIYIHNTYMYVHTIFFKVIIEEFNLKLFLLISKQSFRISEIRTNLCVSLFSSKKLNELTYSTYLE